jgi:cytochrome c oxidase subunit 2
LDSFDPVTRQGLEISNLFGFELIVSALLLALVLGWLVMALVRFRASPGDATEPPQVHGQRQLEIIWTAIPALILAIVFVLVVQTMRSVDAAEPDAQRVKVIGHQWWWEFVYTDFGGVVTANEMHLPVATSLILDLESDDVLHSFWVPRFGMMRDLVPGKTNRMSIRVDRAGTFDGACTQLCGAQHAWMRSRVIAEPPDQFQAWLTQQQQAATESNARGQQVFLQNTCVSCHTIRGLQAPARVGPDLTHFGSRTTLGAGVLPNTVDNLRRWLRNPQAIKPGVLMPAFANLSAEDLAALADYLDSLK